ncbi:MAG TPA: hypothetical protein VL523_17660 [Terriglobia bacterium]|nr:hypothetical protein [Terriglobia bacterium]
MAKLYPVADGSEQRLQAALKRARTPDGLRRVQCIWMRVALGMDAISIAAALGWSPRNVRDVQRSYLSRGDALFDGPGRGGRRHELMTVREEYELFRTLREQAAPSRELPFERAHRAVEAAVGRRVDPSTVHRMLKRHGWHHAALVTASPDTLTDAARERQRGRTGLWTRLRDDQQPDEPGASPAPEPDSAVPDKP